FFNNLDKLYKLNIGDAFYSVLGGDSYSGGRAFSGEDRVAENDYRCYLTVVGDDIDKLHVRVGERYLADSVVVIKPVDDYRVVKSVGSIANRDGRAGEAGDNAADYRRLRRRDGAVNVREIVFAHGKAAVQ